MKAIVTACLVLALGQDKPPTDGLVGYWKLDEAAGPKAADASGKGNAGTHQGDPAPSDKTPERFVNARSLSFDGKNARVNAGEAASLSMKTALTVTAWVHPTAEAGEGNVIVNKEGEFEFGRSGEGNLQFALSNDNPGWSWVDTGFALPLKKWTHVAWTYSAEKKKAIVYADGKQVFADAADGEIGDNYPDANQFWIGARQKEGGAEFFAGNIAEVRLYNRALNPEEIRAVYAASFKK